MRTVADFLIMLALLAFIMSALIVVQFTRGIDIGAVSEPQAELLAAICALIVVVGVGLARVVEEQKELRRALTGLKPGEDLPEANPVRKCPNCGKLRPASFRACMDCGHVG